MDWSYSICLVTVSIKGKFSPLESPLSSQPNTPLLTFHPPLSNCLRKDLQASSGTVTASQLSSPLIVLQAQQSSTFNAICNHESVLMPFPIFCCPYLLPLSFFVSWLFLDSRLFKAKLLYNLALWFNNCLWVETSLTLMLLLFKRLHAFPFKWNIPG